MLFMAAMLGISLSNNLIILLVFWELTSISSFLLVGYWSHYEALNVARVWHLPLQVWVDSPC